MSPGQICNECNVALVQTTIGASTSFSHGAGPNAPDMSSRFLKKDLALCHSVHSVL